MTIKTMRGNRTTHEMRADNVFVTNAHILYHFIAKMSIVFPFRSSDAAAARRLKAVVLPSVMPRFAPFYHRRRAGFPYRAGKGQSRLSKRPHILTKSKPPLWGDAIRDAYTDEKTTAHHVPALRHRSAAGTILPGRPMVARTDEKIRRSLPQVNRCVRFSRASPHSGNRRSPAFPASYRTSFRFYVPKSNQTDRREEPPCPCRFL